MCDYDPASFMQESVRRARKNYCCEECIDPIEAGQRYTYIFGIWDGEVLVYRSHVACRKMYLKYTREQEDGHTCYAPFGDTIHFIANKPRSISAQDYMRKVRTRFERRWKVSA